MGVVSLYFTFLNSNTLKRSLTTFNAIKLILLNLIIGSALLGIFLYGFSLVIWSIFFGVVPGIALILYNAVLTHLILKIFSQRLFKRTLSSFAFASIPALLSWIPFVNYAGILLSIFVLIRALALQHSIKWYKAVIALLIVMAINYVLLFLVGMILGGSV